jgi:hypothetical protein
MPWTAVASAGIFTPGVVYLPHQNPEYPGGTSRAAANRRWDLVWTQLDFDPSGTENASQGPWVRRAAFSLRVQYELARPEALAPRDRQLTLGALAAASQRALDDATLVEWAFLRPAAWSGVAIGYQRAEPITVAQVDTVRAVATLSGSILFSQSAVTAPTPWTP